MDKQAIKEKSVKGIVALTMRSLLLQGISFIATFLLTVFLAPNIFGTFYVVSAIINFLAYFSDIGLAGALIQKKDVIEDADLRTTFTIQQILVGSVVLAALFLSSRIGSFYNLDLSGTFLFQALIISFFLSSLKTIPSILLERKLDFNKLVIPQIAETLVFNVIAVILAWKGYGIASFSVAVLARGIVGLIVMYLVSPWKIGFGINTQSAKSLLKFGVPFQLNSVLALIKDDLMTVFLGKILTLTEVGYVGWAQKWALLPLRTVMDNVIRVTFPAYSRLQEDKEALKKAIEKAVYFVSLFVFPVLIILSVSASIFVEIIPRYGKWQPALLSLYLFCINAAWGAVSTPITNALNAIGKIKVTLNLMVMWTVLTWTITPILIFKIGFNGVALSLALIPFTSILTIVLIKRYVKISVWENVKGALLSSICVGVLTLFIKTKLPQSFLSVIIIIITGIITYIAFIFLIEKHKIIGEIKSVLKFK